MQGSAASMSNARRSPRGTAQASSEKGASASQVGADAPPVSAASTKNNKNLRHSACGTTESSDEAGSAILEGGNASKGNKDGLAKTKGRGKKP
eukprot:3125270-Rhodomonas_salina.1